MLSAIGSLFGPRKTPEEMMREYKRSIDRSVRDLEKERTKLQTQEKKLIADMKKAAKQDQMDSVKIMAKDIVRTRKYAQKFYRMKAQLTAVSLRLQTLTSTAQMANAMQGVTRAMRSMNMRMNLPQMQKIMQEFERQNEIMGMKEEMMGEAIDEAMDDEGDEEEETDQMVQQVMDEVGMDFKSKVGVIDSALPSKTEAVANGEDDEALEKRLNALKASMK
eukprot:PhF_6_TR41649/c0_g1_i1/m.63141/K12191/CHMP2A; charged multivesicular body protein 2A